MKEITQEIIENMLSNCTLCPRKCHANRIESSGFCGANGTDMHISKIMLHKWEEPIISGTPEALDINPKGGSGAVFFTHCTLGCVYCQNTEISGKNVSKALYKDFTSDELASALLKLESLGAYNINFVSGTHYIPLIVRAVQIARESGLSIPIVWNTSGYETLESLKLLDGIVDIYLTDWKYSSKIAAKKYSFAENYPEVIRAGMQEMYRQVGAPILGDNGMMQRGVIVRHLVLPGRATDARHIIQELYETYGDNIVYSVMNQYTPLDTNVRLKDYPELLQPTNIGTYTRATDLLGVFNPKYAFVQEGGAISESFIPHWGDFV